MVYNAAVACAAQLVVSWKFGVVQTVTTELSSLVSTTKAARLPVECVENIKDYNDPRHEVSFAFDCHLY
jgi:hypothetical protein